MEYRILNNAKYRILNKISKIGKQFFSESDIQHSAQAGVATLPTVLLLGAMALVVAVSVTALSFTELFISQGSAQSSRAQFYAEAGARDALIRVARNMAYTCPGAACYQIEFSPSGCPYNDCAQVTVEGASSPKTITSKGIMKSSTRTLQVTATLDTNGQITATTWNEVTN